MDFTDRDLLVGQSWSLEFRSINISVQADVHKF
jgi:hypothetical protein